MEGIKLNNRKHQDKRRRSDNTGQVTVNTEGNMSLGVGNGLSVDASDGSVGFKVGPVTVDTPSAVDYGSSSSYDSGNY
jgi:hypothetical protein